MDTILSAILLIVIIIILLFACLFVFCTMPNKYRFFDMPSAYCHRGYYDNEKIAENSIPAFEKCSKLGLGAELDIRYTADKKLVVFHDDNLTRMCGENKKVSELTYNELSRYKLLSTDEHIPLLDDVLKMCGEIPLCCEIKSEDYEPDPEFMNAIFEALSEYPGQFVIESFNPYVLGWFKNEHPEIIRGQLSAGSKTLDLGSAEGLFLSNLLVNAISRPDFVAFKYDNISLGLAMNRIYGTRLVAWTVHSMEEVESAAENGYSTFIAENFDITEI